MGLTAAWSKFKPHAEQRRLWTSPSRFRAVPAGRGSGKTEMAQRFLVRHLPVKMSHTWADHTMYAYCGPTRDQAKRIAWEHLQALAPEAWVESIRETLLRIRCKFASHTADLYVCGMDKPQRIEGSQWDGIILDESSDLKPKTFDLSVLPALTWRNGWCWRIGVPKRAGPSAIEFREFFEKSAAGDVPDADGFTWPSSEIVPRDEIEWALNNMDPRDYLEQYDAKFQTAGGGIFHAFDRERNVRPCAYNSSRAIVVGSDFNVNPMCWCLGHVRPGPVFEWFDELFKRDTNTQEALDVLWDRYSHHRGGWEFYGDATGRARKTSASESDYLQIYNDGRFRSAGRTVHYPDGPPPVRDRFAACNAMLCNARGIRRMFVDPRCEHLIRDLEMRHYRPGTTEPADSKDLGHMTDAMGYVTLSLFPIEPDVGGGIPTVTITTGDWNA